VNATSTSMSSLTKVRSAGRRNRLILTATTATDADGTDDRSMPRNGTPPAKICWRGWLFSPSWAVEMSNARAVNALLMDMSILLVYAPSIRKGSPNCHRYLPRQYLG
jgi:hypothetical protein